MNLIANLFLPVLDVFPLLGNIPPLRGKLKEGRKQIEKLDEFFENKIKDCMKQTNTSDTFVREFYKRDRDVDLKNLTAIVNDLIGAGTETAATHLGWALLLIGNRPSLQTHLQSDIDRVLPRDRLPCLDDKAKLPFLEATILEVLRYTSVVALGIPHLTMCETELKGFTIPYNTTVITNVWAAHRDPRVWNNPDEFCPERFLDENEQIINKNLVLSFSLGKRSCLGEMLAWQELFLFLTAILQQFNILPPEGEEKIREKTKPTIIIMPAPFQIRLVEKS
jgi:cytochrome P450 family 2 subfamily U polypeptide 1